MNRSLVLLAAAMFAVTFAGRAADQPSVLVETTLPKSGSVPRLVSIYGSAVPRLDANRSVSVQAQGSVSEFAVTPGEHVNAGERLLVFQRSQAAVSAIEQARNSAKLANAELSRMRLLLSQQLATRDQVSQAERAAGDAKAALDALLAVGGGKQEFDVSAPFSGIVMTVPVAQGSQLSAGTTLLTMVRDAGLVVTAGVEPSEAPQVAAGESATLSPLAGGTPIAAHVSRVDRAINPQSHLIDVDIAATRPLIPGAAYRADVVVSEAKGWIVPRAAVQLAGSTHHVFEVVGAKAKSVPVTVHAEQGEQVVVEGALSADRPVAVAGSYQLTDGATVRLAQGQPGPK